MPDSAANPAHPSVSLASADDSAFNAPAASDADSGLACAKRSAHALLTPRAPRLPYGAPTFDLFAEDAERAMLQALNTDIRQCTLPGFELPEVFMAAVEAATAAGADDHSASVRLARQGTARDAEAASNASAVPNGPSNGELVFAPSIT